MGIVHGAFCFFPAQSIPSISIFSETSFDMNRLAFILLLLLSGGVGKDRIGIVSRHAGVRSSGRRSLEIASVRGGILAVYRCV